VRRRRPGPGEECDDGADNGDMNSCKADCTNAFCGDGQVGPGEGCDDGNQVDDDECSNDCVASTCGDGKVAATEECDDGNADDTDACTTACTNAVCSDGFEQPSNRARSATRGRQRGQRVVHDRLQGRGVRRRQVVWNTDGGDEECDNGAENGPGKAVQRDVPAERVRRRDLGPDEECDDGNNAPATGARRCASWRQCGNAIVDPGEGCDDGKNGDNDDGCTDACARRRCAATGSSSQQGRAVRPGRRQQRRGGVHAGLQERGVRRQPDPAKRRAVRRRGQQRPGKACKATARKNVCGDGDKSARARRATTAT
jgi:cysteine-rich repeat protein